MNAKTWSTDAEAPALPPDRAFWEALANTCCAVRGATAVAVVVEAVVEVIVLLEVLAVLA